MESVATATPHPGSQYGAVFETTYDPNAGLRQGGVSDRLRDRIVREEHARLAQQGYEPATVVNLMPFALSVNLGELGILEVPAATPEMPERRLVIDRYRLSMRDLGNGNFSPVSVLPAELAKELEREYHDTGGVFWYRGAGEPRQEEIIAALGRMAAYYRKEFQKAVDSWSRYHQHKLITDRQRDAARALFSAGEIAALPAWVAATKSQVNLKVCPDCGEDVKAMARICWRCRFEFSPLDPPAADDESGLPDPTAARPRHKK